MKRSGAIILIIALVAGIVSLGYGSTVVRYEKNVSIVDSLFTALAGSATDKLIHMDKGWYTYEELNHLPAALYEAKQKGIRVIAEVPQNKYNRKGKAMFRFFGGRMLERLSGEPAGKTEVFDDIWLRYNRVIIDQDVMISPDEKTKTVDFVVPAECRSICVVLEGEIPGATVALIRPDGNVCDSVKTGPRTLLTQSFEVANPVSGKWTLNIAEPGDHHVAVFMADDPVEFTMTAAAGGVNLTVSGLPAGCEKLTCVYEIASSDPLASASQRGALIPVSGNSTEYSAEVPVSAYPAYVTIYMSGSANNPAVPGTGQIVYQQLVRTVYWPDQERIVICNGLPQGGIMTAEMKGSVDIIAPASVSQSDFTITVDGEPVKDLTLTDQPNKKRKQLGFSVSKALGEGGHKVNVTHKNTSYDYQFTINAAASKDLILTEVKPGRDMNFAEIMSLRDDLDVSRYQITDMDGKEEYLSQNPLTLNNGELAVIAWTRGITESDMVGDKNGNKVRNIYIDAPCSLYKDDQMALKKNGVIIDAVAWTDRDGKLDPDEQKDIRALIEAGEWDPMQTVKIGKPGSSLARINFEDANRADEWYYQVTPNPGKVLRKTEMPKTIAIGDIIINEFSLKDPGQSDWIELKAVTGPINLADLTLSDLDGEDQKLHYRPITLKAGEFAVIHCTAGATEDDVTGDLNKNNVRDIYQPHQHISAADNQLVLSYGEDLIDAVIFSNYDGQVTADEIKDINALMEKRVWTASGAGEGVGVSYTSKGVSLGRTGGKDTNHKADWQEQIAATPGKENLVLENSMRGKLLISEVSIGSGNDWIELYAVTGPVDLKFITLTSLNGDKIRLSRDANTLKTGEIALVWLKEGLSETDNSGDLDKSGGRDLFLPDMRLTSTEDQAVIYLGDKIVDAVCWSNQDGKISKNEEKDLAVLISQKEWAGSALENSCVGLGKPSQSIGRTVMNKDTNKKDDWAVQVKPSPGSVNKEVTVKKDFVIKIAAVDPNGKPFDWAELFCAEGEADISAFQLTDLDGADQRLSVKPFTIKKGETVKVLWRPGITESDGVGDKNGSGIREIFLIDEALAATDDQLALMLDDKIIDAVAWTNNDGSVSKEELKDCQFLVTKGCWQGTFTNLTDQKDLVNIGLYRRPVKRKDPKSDANNKSDWVSY